MKAKVSRPDGSTVEVEGTPEEIRGFLAWEHLLAGPPQIPVVIPITVPVPAPYIPNPLPWSPIWTAPGTADPLPKLPYITCGDPPNTCSTGSTLPLN